MSDNKKYYYMRVKENFYETEDMVILQSMDNGYLYSYILMKLYLRSLKNEGKLMFNNKIPFNSEMLAQVTRHSVGVVEKAMCLFKELSLVEMLDNGAIFMSEIQNFIGEGSTEADRVREYRKRIDTEKTLSIEKCTNVQQMYDKCTPEIEIEKELDLELKTEIELETEKKKISYQLYADAYNSTCQSLPKCAKLTDKRKKAIKSVKKTFSDDEIRQAFSLAEKSDFLSNREGKGFTAGFDWIMNVSNMAKILEGNYRNKPSSNPFLDIAMGGDDTF